MEWRDEALMDAWNVIGRAMVYLGGVKVEGELDMRRRDSVLDGMQEWLERYGKRVEGLEEE